MPSYCHYLVEGAKTKMPKIIFYCLYHGSKPLKYFRSFEQAYDYLTKLNVDDVDTMMKEYRIEKVNVKEEEVGMQ